MNQKRIREAFLQVALQPRHLARTISRQLSGAAVPGQTVLSLDGQWLKLLTMEGAAGSRKITKLAVCPVQDASPEEILARVKELCATEGIAPADVLIAAPTHLSTIRLFTLPSTDSTEIRDIVDLQAEKHTPYAKDEILTDFKVIERERAGYSKVLLAIAHQDVIHRAVRLVESLGWTLERVGLELEGLVHWVQSVRKAAGGKPPTGSPPTSLGIRPERAAGESKGSSLVVDIDGDNTVLLVIQRGQPQFQRSLATGIEQLEDVSTHAGERLVSELQRSIEALEGEEGVEKVQEVFLTGPVQRLGGFKTLIERGLSLPVHLISPWEGANLSEEARASLTRLPDVSFASLVGLSGNPGELDLTPQTTKLRLAFEAKAKALVLLGCQFIGALILVSLLFIGRAQKEERYYRKLRALHNPIAQSALEVEREVQQLKFIETHLRQQGQMLSAVTTLAQLAPPEITWNALSFTQGTAIVLAGTTDYLPKVYEYSGGIAGTPEFGEVEARRIAKRKDGDRDVTDFELFCPLEATP